MVRRPAPAVLAAAVVAALLAWWWWSAASPAEREIRGLFEEFAEEFNAGSRGGLATLAHAVRLGEFFTADVVVELGQGSPPLHGRETLVGIVSRLQSRTAAFVVEMDDVTVELSAPERGDVTFTAVIRRRSVTSGEESIDAREFASEVVRADGRWRVSRVVAIDTLR